VKLLAQRQLRARAWPYADNPELVRLRIGSIDYVMNGDEATDLADELVTAVEQSRAMLDAADGTR
jgi:hypothetical protein